MLIPVPWLMGGHTTFEYYGGKKKEKKNEYNGSSFCLTVHLLFHKVTVQPVTIVYAYRKNEHNEVPNRKNPPLLF